MRFDNSLVLDNSELHVTLSKFPFGWQIWLFKWPIFVHTGRDTGVCLSRVRHTVMLHGRVSPGVGTRVCGQLCGQAKSFKSITAVGGWSYGLLQLTGVSREAKDKVLVGWSKESDKMSTEPTFIEGSVTPPTSIDSENLGVGASSQANVTTGKRKATPQSHKGESIGMVIEKCLLNWGIDKLFTVTVDNASSNDVAIGYLRKKFNPRGGLVQNGKYLHMRCMGAVRYVRQSPARLQKFKECVVVEKIECKKMLCLNVCTRWNSTYLMLDTAQNFERAFERFEEQDTNFRAELERGEGWLSVDDWTNVRDLRDFLEHFYELNSNIDFNVMAIKMKEKYDKYWGDIDKINLLIFVACVLDPRQKESLYELFDEYKPSLHSTCSQSSVSTHVSLGEPQQKMKRQMQALYKKCELEICGEDKTSKLDKYLAEANEEFVEDFDILLWWKVNSLRFPTLSEMARDVLAIPISTVALESAFSTGGRVLDQYRSSLTPKIVQALVCTQDWIRKSSSQEDIKKIEEEIQELDKIENGVFIVLF
ncbi:hypothetical protein CXB51_014142 [Gossypium anomalum]|uniref:Zinc finger BED domain-containing protein RICESLEEPER 2-like n=1 Tax=Gossypium anomalum TaxID=47600 RepID=A0A8J6CXF0_9ROSI|nr:hypothetical protein CXB51_014142 [Gossypium anomalum]